MGSAPAMDLLENVKCIDDPIPHDVRPLAEAACGSHACHKNES